MGAVQAADLVCLAAAIASLPVCAALCVFDLRERILPNRLVAVLALCGAATLPSSALVPFPAAERLAWAVGTLLVLAAAELLWRRLRGSSGIGAGDVKLLGASALFLGPLVAAQLLIACAAAVLVAALRRSARPFAFGPYLVGGLVSLLLCSSLLMW